MMWPSSDRRVGECCVARAGFTLAETLVLVGIGAVLLGLLLPSIQRVRSTMNRMACAANLRQLGLALHSHHLGRQALPSGCSFQSGKHPEQHLSWCARLLPYLGEDYLWQRTQEAFRAEPFFLKPPHGEIRGKQLKFLSCPSDDRLKDAILRLDVFGNTVPTGYTSYLGVAGTNQATFDGLLFLDSRTRFADIIDGLSSTLLAGERPPSALLNAGWWYAGWGMAKNGAGDMHLGVRELNRYPADYFYGQGNPIGPYAFVPGNQGRQQDMFHFWSMHPGGAHFLFADGSVHFLRYSADELLPALATRAGKEPVLLDD